MSTFLPILALLVTASASERRTPEAAPPVVSWKTLSDHPGDWLGKTVRLRVQLQGRVETWNPYLTRFGSRQFAAVQAWADEQYPWIKAEYDAPAVRVFLRRGEACDWALEKIEPNARFEMTGIVRETFLDLPWIELQEVLPLPERITEGTLIHAGKAQQLIQERAYARAESELDQAITDDLPPLARTELERLRTLCRQAVALDQRTNRSSSARR
jgi:hypothetical protein